MTWVLERPHLFRTSLAVSQAHHTKNPEYFINREISWLEFNQRVLDQAMDSSVRLLERVKFLAITCSNLDEFFMVRVGGLQLQHAMSSVSTEPSGMTVSEQLEAISHRTEEMFETQYQVYLEELEPELVRQGIERIRVENCSLRHSEAVRRIFEEEIFAVLSPMGIDPEEQFPLLVSRTLHLCVQLDASEGDEQSRFAIIPLGVALPRVLTMPTDQGFSFALLEDVVHQYIPDFFPGEKVLGATAFRITRNADISLQEDAAPDLMHGMKEILAQRKTAQCVRLELEDTSPKAITEFLQERLKVSEEQTTRLPAPIDLSFLMKISGLEGYQHLQDEPWPAQRSPKIDPTTSMFETIAERDILLCHPYEGYGPVVRLIEEAADDPDVLAIKQTLYRTSRDSAIVSALKRAAERGKYVTTIVELKARFDEARNIEWAQELEHAGVQVIYGVRNLKTHAKICIIVRREARGIMRYVHFGTGNYNESTARLYSDISYFSCRDELGQDSSSFFNAITGYSQPQQYSALEAAPIGLRKKLLTLIESETVRCQQGQPAEIAAKLNALVDPELIAALYRASQAGVKVLLNVRGICCLRPGVPGLSANIRVVSIVDRLLEHARMAYFKHGGDDLAFISSADWMPRNLDKRIELLVPILDKSCKQQFMSILKSYFEDTTNTWELDAQGAYHRLDSTENPRRCQAILYKQAVEAIKLAEQQRSTMFEPHQSQTQRDLD